MKHGIGEFPVFNDALDGLFGWTLPPGLQSGDDHGPIA
jgi:hypothetical protein